MNINDILNNKDVYLVRKSNLPESQSFNTAKRLKAGAIKLSQIPKLSCNILGGQYKPEDIHYKIKDAAAKLWEGQRIRLRDFRGHYSKEVNTAIYICATGINNLDVPFVAPNNKVNSTRANGLPFEPTSNNGMKLMGKTKIIHSPSNLNYWHIELLVEDFHGKTINSSSNKFNEYACDFILDIISENAEMNSPQTLFEIKRRYYRAS